MEENLTQEESLIKRIVICGPESTGKTTMINSLAVYFQTNYVDEFARYFLQNILRIFTPIFIIIVFFYEKI